jgi:polyhydroxyalkanoate synthesis repressor PhaR
MQLIKKYANRKLYHTNEKRYITLEGIARLVQAGDPVQVLDNETGEDITTSILAQVVLYIRERKGVKLPAAVLMNLIELGNDTLANMRQVMFDSLVGQDHIDAEINRRINHLQEEGTLSADEATHLRTLLLRNDLTVQSEPLGTDEALIPTRNDILRLQEQVDTLALALEQLFQQQSS